MGLCKDGYWRICESYEGRRYMGCGKTRKEATKNLAEKIADAKSGTAILNGSTTVKHWSEEWLAVYIKPKVRAEGKAKAAGTMSQKSYAMYTQKLKIILPAIGHMKLHDVRDFHLRHILNSQAGKSKSHVSKIRIVIKAMFRQAYDSRLISFDPAASLELPATEEGKRRSLTDQERDLLLRACEIHRCGLWIKLLLNTGIRPGESAPLLVKDFDLKTGLLNIDKDIESGTYCVSDPKTKAGIRKVPIPTDMIPELQEYFAGKSPFVFAFPQMNGTMKSQTCLSNDWRSFRRCMDILGGAQTIWKEHKRTISIDGYEKTNHGRIMTEEEDGENGSVLADDLVLYCLRHTFCTDLQKAGVPVNIASYLMGHSDIQTTANIYTHTGEEDALSAAVNINNYRQAKKANVKKDVKIQNNESDNNCATVV